MGEYIEPYSGDRVEDHDMSYIEIKNLKYRYPGATELALTKLDVLSYLKEIPVCVKYDIDGEITDKFPSGDRLKKAKPVYEFLEGWCTDVSGCRSFDELPEKAKEYIRYVEKAVDCKIKYVSVGPDRDQYMVLD